MQESSLLPFSSPRRSLRPRRRASARPYSSTAGSYGIGVAADTDAAGSTTALVAGYGHGPRLFERPSGGAWSAATPLPGNPAGMAGPVVDAAGSGALGIAWRVDKPRSYSAIAVAMRDPGGTLSEPIEIAGADAGRRAPPGAGDRPRRRRAAGLQHGHQARSTSTCAARSPSPTARAAARSLRRRSSIDAVERARRRLARDGTGVVAWTHDRHVYAVSVDAGGSIGKVKRIASPDGVVGLVAAAGERGAATLAWVDHRAGAGTQRSPRSRYFVRALGRTAGHAFASTSTVASTSDYVRGVSIAADEGGQVTLAWGREHFGTIARWATTASRARSSRPLREPGSRSRRRRSSPDGGCAT